MKLLVLFSKLALSTFFYFKWNIFLLSFIDRMELFLQNAANYIYVRGVRGGILFYDPINCQLYRRTGAVGADNHAEFVRVVRCVTVPTLRSLGHNLAGYPAPDQQDVGDCGGHPAIEVHHDHPLFEDRDLRMLYLRHGLRLRVLLHRSKKPALVFFRELWARYFPGQPCIDYHGRTLIRSMGYALKSAANDGVLFVTGSEQDVGGPVTRETRPELARNFPTADRLMEVYAKCYEWVHWEVIMLRFGKSIYTMQCRESLSHIYPVSKQGRIISMLFCSSFIASFKIISLSVVVS